MAGWTIRRAVADDALALAACIDAAYAVYRERIDDLPSISEGIAADIDHHLVWVALRDQVIVGGLVLILRKEALRKEALRKEALRDEAAMLANIAVDPASSGMGIGRGLIERAEAHCRALGKTELRLTTHIAMPENVRLYQHLGWQETGRSENKVHMTKPL